MDNSKYKKQTPRKRRRMAFEWGTASGIRPRPGTHPNPGVYAGVTLRRANGPT